jgi:hypothetical protein
MLIVSVCEVAYMAYGGYMRVFRRMALMLLVGLSTTTPVCAGTTIHFRGQTLFVPPWIVLIVGGLALLAIGGWLKKLYRG